MKPMKVEAILEIAPKTSYSSNLKHPNALSMADSIGVMKNSE